MTEKELYIGASVRSNFEFSGVKRGSLGIIVEASNSWPDTESVCVEWHNRCGCGGLCDSKEPCPMAKPILRDWFSFDELQYLDLVVGGV